MRGKANERKRETRNRDKAREREWDLERELKERKSGTRNRES